MFYINEADETSTCLNLGVEKKLETIWRLIPINNHKEKMTKMDAIRPMRKDEKKLVNHLARQAFGWLHWLFFSLSEHTFIYELDGQVAGVVVVDKFTYNNGCPAGVVKWLFTEVQARGKGIAAALLDHALRYLEEEGCQEIFTTIEGYNTASINRFADQGFLPLGFVAQVRLYGLGIIQIALNNSHTFDLGHFLWVRPGPQSSGKGKHSFLQNSERSFLGGGSCAWWVNVAIMAVLLIFQQLRVGQISEVSLDLLWQAPLVVAMVFGVRTAAMKLTANYLGFKLHYRPWESGLTLSAIITLVFGGLLPSTGSYYPGSLRWSYQRELPRLGLIAFNGSLAVLSLAWVMYAFMITGPDSGVPEVITETIWLALLLAQVLLVFEILLPFFPFSSYNGRRVWDLNRALWIVLALGTASLFLVRIIS